MVYVIGVERSVSSLSLNVPERSERITTSVQCRKYEYRGRPIRCASRSVPPGFVLPE